MWGTTSIARRVSKVIKKRTVDAQKEHDEQCRVLDQECEDTKKNAELSRDLGKEAHAEMMVSKIIGI